MSPLLETIRIFLTSLPKTKTRIENYESIKNEWLKLSDSALVMTPWSSSGIKKASGFIISSAPFTRLLYSFSLLIVTSKPEKSEPMFEMSLTNWKVSLLIWQKGVLFSNTRIWQDVNKKALRTRAVPKANNFIRLLYSLSVITDTEAQNLMFKVYWTGWKLNLSTR